MPVRAKYIDPDFRNQSKSPNYCVVCGRAINPKRPHRLVHLIGYEGEEKMGMDCARNLGLEWSRPMNAGAPVASASHA